jgi:hypothetical protein
MAFKPPLRLHFKSGYNVSLIPKENVLTEAYLNWERAGRLEGRELEHYLKAENSFRNYIIISDEDYNRFAHQLRNCGPGKLDLDWFYENEKQIAFTAFYSHDPEEAKFQMD